MSLLALFKEIHETDFKKNKRGGHGKYLTLDALLDQILPIIYKHGYVFTQGGDMSTLEPALTSELRDGEGDVVLSFTMPLVMGNNKTAQTLGSAVTYARRYAILSMFSIMPDDDDEGTATVSNAKPFVSKSKVGNS